MALFDHWCEYADVPLGNHHIRLMTGRQAHATVGIQATAAVVPTHYAAEERIAHALQRLGKPAAAQLIIDSLPQTAQIRSGDLGEIYATEWINAHSGGYRAPIKRRRKGHLAFRIVHRNPKNPRLRTRVLEFVESAFELQRRVIRLDDRGGHYADLAVPNRVVTKQRQGPFVIRERLESTDDILEDRAAELTYQTLGKGGV
jgi:hypothetical protein